MICMSKVNFDIYIKISGIYEWEGLIKMKIIKRSGSEVTFDITKIMAAVSKANQEVVHSERLSDEQIKTISDNVESICEEMNRSLKRRGDSGSCRESDYEFQSICSCKKVYYI